MESSSLTVADETALSMASHPLILPDKDDNASSDKTVAVGANTEQLRQQQQPPPPPDHKETITCPVCYDACTLVSTPPPFVSTSSKPAIQVNDCGHTFCHDCLLKYCEYHISMRKLPVPCPMMTSATTAIDTGDGRGDIKDRVGDRGGDSRETPAASTTFGGTKNHWRSSSKKRRFAPRKKTIQTPNRSRHDRAHGGACPTVLSSTIMQLVLTRQHANNNNNNGTRAEQSPNENEAAAASALWIKYQRLQRLLADPSLVECTRCSEVVSSTAAGSTTSNSRVGSTGGTEPSPWSRSCPGCQHVFCALHGDAHLGRSCDDPAPVPNDQYDVETSPNTNSTSPLGILDIPNDDDDDTHHTNATTKPCSHCHVPLHKYAGCDHVVCPACHGDMCFRCGTHVHLSGTMARYCAQCQQGYLDHRYIWRIRLYYCLFMPLLLPLLILYMAVALLLIVLTGCCCCCFCCGNEMKNNRDTDASNNNANEGDNNHHHPKKFHPGRGVAAVSGILLFPTLLILFDMGWQVPWFDDWLDGLGGCTGTEADVDGGGTTNGHTAQQLVSMEEGRDN